MRNKAPFFFSVYALLIFFAPFFFGSVSEWAYFFLAACLFLLLLLSPNIVYEALKLPAYFRNVSCLVMIWTAGQAFFWAADKNAAQAHLLLWLAFAALFLSVQQLSMIQIRRLFLVFIVTAVFQAIYGAYQMNQSPEMVLWQVKESHHGYLTGTYINRNHCAGLLQLALGVSTGMLGCALSQKKYFQAGGYGLIFLILCAALIKTGSRFGVFSFALTLTAAIAWAGNSHRFKNPILLLGLMFWLLMLTQAGTLLERFQLDEGYLPTVTGRVWVWQDAFSMLKDYWLQGIGLGGFERVFTHYQSPRLLLGWAHAHQDYLELANELGLPFFILWVSAWAGFWARASATLSFDTEIRSLTGGLSIGLASMVIHGLMDFNFAIPANTFLWIFLAGCLERLRRFASYPQTGDAKR